MQRCLFIHHHFPIAKIKSKQAYNFQGNRREKATDPEYCIIKADECWKLEVHAHNQFTTVALLRSLVAAALSASSLIHEVHRREQIMGRPSLLQRKVHHLTLASGSQERYRKKTTRHSKCHKWICEGAKAEALIAPPMRDGGRRSESRLSEGRFSRWAKVWIAILWKGQE